MVLQSLKNARRTAAWSVWGTWRGIGSRRETLNHSWYVRDACREAHFFAAGVVHCLLQVIVRVSSRISTSLGPT